MLTAFLDRLGGLFDRRFIVAFWAPTFLTASLAIITALALRPGLGTALETGARLTANAQIVLGAGALLAITVLAYLLQPLTFPLLRFYEGYWPGWMQHLSAWAIDNQRAALSRLKAAAPDTAEKTQALHGLHRAGAYYQRYLHFPRNEDLLRPTQLGNAFTAAEEYPYQVYNLDAILWWPRLTPLLPDPLRTQLDQEYTPLVALLNLSAELTLLAVAGGIYLAATAPSAWVFVLGVTGCLLAARLCYLAAVSQAVSYGSLIRVAFDLHRQDVLKQMHIAPPDNLMEERILWDALNQWVYRFIPPAESGWPFNPQTYPAPTADPFYYDSHRPPVAAAGPSEMIITVQGSPALTLRQEEAPHA